MKRIETPIAGLFVFEPKVFGDARGFFLESYNARNFRQLLGSEVAFVQDNHSRSQRGVLRGLHYQIQQAQAKLVRVTQGAVWDVAVDLRRSSATFGQHFACELSAENHRQMWIPEGMAHGFLVLSEVADFLYKTTDFYAPEHERCLRWDDPALGLAWPLAGLAPELSAKDRLGKPLAECDVFD